MVSKPTNRITGRAPPCRGLAATAQAAQGFTLEESSPSYPRIMIPARIGGRILSIEPGRPKDVRKHPGGPYFWRVVAQDGGSNQKKTGFLVDNGRYH